VFSELVLNGASCLKPALHSIIKFTLFKKTE